MICHEHKCIFIHPPKTAGESVEIALSGKPFNLPGREYDGHPEKHWSAKKIKQMYPKEFSTYFKFSIVRNPWDRFLSWVYYLNRKYDRNTAAFQEYMHQDLKNDYIVNRSNAYNMLFIDGEIAVDLVLRFENLANDFLKLEKMLEGFSLTLPHANKSTRNLHYGEEYDYYCYEFIAQSQKFEIDYFNYEYEGDFKNLNFFIKSSIRLQVIFQLKLLRRLKKITRLYRKLQLTKKMM